MTQDKIVELVKHTREEVDEMRDTAHFCGRSINQKHLGKVLDFYAEKITTLADALEQQTREIAFERRSASDIIQQQVSEINVLHKKFAACEGALRNSGGQMRELERWYAKMTSDEIAELVSRLRYMSAVWNDNRNLLEAANALEQQAREIAAAEARIQEVEKAFSEVFVLRAQVRSLEKHKDTLQRSLTACEGALRDSGNMVRDLNDLAKQYENELTRRDIPLPWRSMS